jgi:hypothetical protein
VAFLVLGVSGSVVHDAILHSHPKPAELEAEEAVEPGDTIEAAFHDNDKVGILGTSGVKADGGGFGTRVVWEASMRFGVVVRSCDGGTRKKLTFEPEGLTNNTCVHLDGNEWLFGERPYRRADGLVLEDWPGRWLERDARLRGTNTGRKSLWIYDEQHVVVTQFVEIVDGPQTRQKDTCLVRYHIENRDRIAHQVGIRFLLDTFIGNNDGVPFLLPGASELCSAQHIFERSADVPDFIQACENDDLKNPGTIAHLQLRLGGGLEVPSRVTLGAWPNVKLARLNPRCRQMRTLWDVPVLPIRSMPGGDSAVTMYWDPRVLEPGVVRKVGFSYGLGGMARKQGGGKLAVTIGGDFSPGGEFTVTAYAVNPVEGQTLKLQLPPGFDFVVGHRQQRVPLLRQDSVSRKSPVTWKVRAPRREGDYTLKVESSTGVSQGQTVKITARGIFGEN